MSAPDMAKSASGVTESKGCLEPSLPHIAPRSGKACVRTGHRKANSKHGGQDATSLLRSSGSHPQAL
eukprot:493978-Rhodomonas_salina.2